MKKVLILCAIAAAIFGSAEAFAQCPNGQCSLGYRSYAVSATQTTTVATPCRSCSTYSFQPFGGLFARLFGRQTYSCGSCTAQTSYAPCEPCAPISPTTEFKPGSIGHCDGEICAAPNVNAPNEAASALEDVEAVAPCSPAESHLLDVAIKVRGGRRLALDRNLCAWARYNSQLQANSGRVGHFAGGAYSGEIAAGGRTPEEAVSLWLQSNAHRAHLLGNYTRVGVGCYSGQFGTFWTMRFSY